MKNPISRMADELNTEKADELYKKEMEGERFLPAAVVADKYNLDEVKVREAAEKIYDFCMDNDFYAVAFAVTEDYPVSNSEEKRGRAMELGKQVGLDEEDFRL